MALNLYEWYFLNANTLMIAEFELIYFYINLMVIYDLNLTYFLNLN